MASQLKSGYPLHLSPPSLAEQAWPATCANGPARPNDGLLSILRVELCELRAVKQHDVALPISDKVEDALAV